MWKLWVRIKWIIGRLMGWIGTLESEIKLIKQYKLSELHLHSTAMYKPDKLLGMPFDYQFDAVRTLNKGGDCNSLHRCYQVYYYNKGYRSYLVTYIAEPFKMSHGFCVYRYHNLWVAVNYDVETHHTCLTEAIEHVASLYQSTPITYVIQDIKWRVTNVRDIK